MYSLRRLFARRLTSPLARPRLRVEQLEGRDNPAPVPGVSLAVEPTPFIGQQNVPVSVTFANNGDQPGYGPWTYVVLPRSGDTGNAANDGVSYVDGSATFLGAPITGSVYTATGTSLNLNTASPTTGPSAAPYAISGAAGTPVTITGLRAGDQVVFFQLPYISFANGQPNATVRFNTNVSDRATLNAPLNLRAGGGFTLGADPLNNPGSDAPLVAATDTETVTPELVRVTKRYVGPEQETATGPNYTRQYVVEARVAPGQTITNFQLRDLLDAGMQYRTDGAFATTGTANGGAFVDTTGTTATTALPGGMVIGNYTQVLGDASPASVDASMTLSFFVPRENSGGSDVVPLGTGVFQQLTDEASARGDWNPLDGADADVTAASAYWTDPIRNPTDVITAKSVATQKGVTVVGGGSPAQNAILEYTIDFQISDYFAFDQLNIPDLLPDGVRFVPGFTPTLEVSQANGPTFTGPFAPANYAVAGTLNGDGTQSLNFNVSGQMGGTGKLFGGWVPNGGTGGASILPDDASPFGNDFTGLSGPATGRIVFRAQVQNTYTVLGGGTNVKQGDALTNTVPTTTPPNLPGGTQPAGGRVLDYANTNNVVSQRADDTAATVRIPTGQLAKTIYAINNQVLGSNPVPRLQNGDVVTYRLTYVLPTSSAQNFRVTDYLPLPVFNATSVGALALGAAGNWGAARGSIPASGTANYGPGTGAPGGAIQYADGTLGNGTSGNQLNPSIVTNGPANTVRFEFPAILQDNAQRTTFVDLLFSVTIADVPFADGFPLTNQANAREGNTPDAPSETDQINQVTLGRPNLTVTKGVVSSSRTGAPAFGNGGATFAAPGSATPFSGTVSSNGLSGSAINSDYSGIDAGDVVTFGVVVQNTGSGHRGAFDVVVNDTLPTGFAAPSGVLNLQFRDGTGAGGSVADAIAAGYSFFTPAGAALTTQAAVEAAFFAGGVRISGGPTAANAIGDNGGVLDPFSGTSGRNLLVITYDLRANDTTQADTVYSGQSLVNTAAVTSYNGTGLGGATNLTPTNVGDLDDTATVVALPPSLVKSLISTSIVDSFNTNAQAVVGEFATYQVTVTIPEGVTHNFSLLDSLPAGMALRRVTGVTLNGVTSTLTPSAPLGGPATNVTFPGGNFVRFNFGTVTNAGNLATGSTANRTITITYEVVVLNTGARPSTGNVGGQTVSNSAQGTFTDPAGNNPQTTNLVTADITVIEPVVTVAKSYVLSGQGATTGNGTSTGTAQAGNTVTYTITLSNPTQSGTNTTTAYDVTLNDPLPLFGTDITYSGTIGYGGPGAYTAANFEITAGGVLRTTAPLGSLLPGQTITLTITGTINGSVTPNQSVSNTATDTWSSLSGTPSLGSTYTSSGQVAERTGSGSTTNGQLNDHTRTGTAAFTIQTPAPTKSIVATSESTTTGNNVAIGEVVRYRLVVQIPRSTINGFQLQDVLPPGLLYLNDGTTRVAVVGANTGTLSVAAGLSGALTTLPGGGIGAVTPTFVLPGGMITNAGTAATFGSGSDPWFTLGDITNSTPDSTATGEFVVIEFNALVENVAGNQAGNTRANTFRSFTGGTPTSSGTANGPASAAVTVTVVEPNVQVDKEVIATTGGTVTYRVTVTNTGPNTSVAHDVVISDALPIADLDLMSVSGLTFGGTGGTGGTTDHDLGAGNRARFTGITLNVDGTVTFTYTVNVLRTPTGTTSIDNTATATATSLTGDNGDTLAATGTTAAALDTPGQPTGERNGSGGVNDHTDSDTERLGSLGDRVYFDANGNGVQDGASEPGIVGVPVTIRWAGPNGLFDGDDTFITVTTGTNGAWSVTGLPLGANQNYRVSVPTSVGGMGLTDVRDNGGAANADPDGLGAGVSAITLTGADAGTTNNRLQDFGYRGTASLGNRVYVDADGDGVQDANGLEPNLPGVTVNLTWAGLNGTFGDADDLTFTTTSGNPANPLDPNYQFNNLPAGNFRVAASATGGSGGVPANMTLTDALDNGGAAGTNPTGSGDGVVQLGGTGGTPIAPLATGENRDTIDFGYRGTASLGDRVYYDVNGDGVQDANEPGIGGATVTLVWGGADNDLGTTADNVTFTTTTAADGTYSFPGLPVNTATDNYRVSTTAPAAFPTFTDSVDNGGPVSTTNPVATTLTPSQNRTDMDFGYRGTAQLGNFVWEDLNANGVQDGSEPGLTGVPVDLFFDANNDGDFLDAGENVAVASTVTAGGGAYGFTNLAAGNYQVGFGTLTGYVRTVRDSSQGTDANDSDGDPTTGRTGTYPLANGGNNQTVDQGVYRRVTLGDRVYFDRDGDGVQDSGEPGIPGATVTVVWLGTDGAVGGTGDAADVTSTTTTGVDGAWGISNLPPGSYRVTVTPPAGQGWVITDSIDNGALSPTNPATISTNSGVDRTDVDYGFRSTVTLGDRVYVDANGNGEQDAVALEPGIPGVTVTLRYDANGDGDFTDADDGLFTTVTDANGNYTFGFLPPGDFQVSVPGAGVGGVPANMTLTDSINNGTLDPTATVPVELTLGNDDLDVDFGYRGNASLGDRVWYDADGDGVQDAGEPGIAGATVTATWFGTDAALGGGDDVTFTTTTDANGNYLFTGLPANALSGGSPNYRVQTTAPAAFPTFTDSLDNGGAVSPVNPVDVQVSPVEGDSLNDRRDVDFGYRGTAQLGDTVWLDVNGNGRQDGGTEVGIDGVPVELFFDADNNGTFEPGELATPLIATTTSGGGNYSFPNLAAGNYRVRFGNAAAGTTYGRTVATSPVAVDATNSDANATTGFTGDYALANGDNNPNVDAGLYVPVTIGDTVWYDTNGDGTQDAAEATLGIPGVVLVLDYAGPDGAFDESGDVSGQATATTDANGQYSFTNLRPGTYRVRVQDATVPVPSLAYTTADGNTQDSVTTSGVDDLARDFGVRGSGTVGDTIFLDVDNDRLPGASERLAGVVVRLAGDLDNDGTVEANETLTATTDASGQYLFTGLRTTPTGVPYTVTVDTTTLPLVGGVAPANTVDPNGGGDSTSAVSLSDTTPNDLAQDFGYRNTAANSGSIGDTIFLDVDGDGVADAGEGITGVRVTLTADIDGDGTPETFTATTDAAGNYRFDGLPFNTPASRLNPLGSPIPYTVTVTTADLPAGVTNTTDPDGGADSTSTVQLSPANPVNLAQDFGYRGDGSIGDTVFLDLNNNGTADAGEGITGATVVLTADVNGDGIQDLTVTATTGPDGEYLFDNLPVNNRTGSPVNYTVRVTGGLPTGVSNTVDPDGTTDAAWTGTLATGPAAPDRRDIDFGYRGTGRLGDRVWLDANGDGVQDAITSEPSLPGVGLTLTYAGQNGTFGDADDITTTVTADTNGQYTFDHLPAGTFRVSVDTATLPGNVTPTFDLDGTGTPHAADATLTTGQARTDVDFGYRGAAGLGDRVWVDQNRNGAQDPGEGGIPGAVVRLVLAGPDGLMSTADDIAFTATTGTNGVYTFGGLPVYGPSSDFRATVLSLPAAGLDAVGDLDSPAGSGDQTVFGGLPANQTRTDVDFGYAGRGLIAGVVFEDVNNDGVRQAGEPAIPGTVLVLEGTDVFGNPLRDPLTGGPLTATADANGDYSFASLPPGTYGVREVQPVGFLDGTDTVGSLGGVPADDQFTQIVLPADGSSVRNNFAEIRPARVAGTVYEDRNSNGRQDQSEPGIPGVRVVLSGTDDRGPVALTLTTDANGHYAFPDLRPGTYTLTQTQPPLFAQGQNTVGTGGGALAGTDVIQTIVLSPGQSATEYRFGEIVRQVSAVPTLPVETVQPWEVSKRMFLSSTTAAQTASVPDFTALGSVNTTRPIQFAATGDDVGGSRVRVYDLTNGRERFRFDPFPGFTGGVRTAVGDLTGDGIPDVVAAAGPGGGPHVTIYNGDTGAVVQSFFAFEAAFRGGSFVATGDFDGDGTADLAVSADRGGGPRVRVFRSGNPGWVMSDFWGIEDVNFRGGARVAAGDVNADGRTDLVVSAGLGGGPRIAVYDGNGLPTNTQNKFVGDFFAFEPTFHGGVYVTVGDVDGDGFAEVIAGAGEGGGPRVRTMSGRELTAGRVTTVTDQFVFDLNGNAGGARVATTDLDGDGRAELFVGTGPGVRPVARFFNPRTGAALNTFSPQWENTISGVFVG